MVNEPKILGFLCHWCCYAAADAAGVARFQYPSYIRTIRVMCTGRIDPVFILDGFVKGADGIFIGGWHLGECHYRSGNFEAIKKIKLIHTILDQVGADKGRVRLEWVSAAEGPRFVQVVTDFSHRIRDLGPVGLSEGVDRQLLLRKLEAAKLATEGMKLRAAFAKQAREMKESSAVFPSEDKLRATLVDEMDIFETLLFLQKNKNDIAELAELLNLPAERVKYCIDTLGRRKIWSGVPYGNSSVNSSGS